jgi:two-component system sensor histidine kinase ResE
MCLASESGVSVSVKCAEGAILADHTRIWQVLLILLDNALRHTPRGGKITIGSELRESRVHISVEDTGEGIAPDDLPHVFERFYKADRSRGDRHSAGLGLSIAKPLVELHGGEIDIHSLQGVRTVVSIMLPAYLALRTAGPQAGLSPAAFPT